MGYDRHWILDGSGIAGICRVCVRNIGRTDANVDERMLVVGNIVVLTDWIHIPCFGNASSYTMAYKSVPVEALLSDIR